ncbi:short-chain dehydrogenase [Billgrantia desiderata SP1]|uniref:SDR family NAD(P)-dependent oxidoreductase n=1 Tax=Billgrantia desiderata TaxID=52021 RepID=UPI000A3BA202|nr:SDR family NAD(P)-dependent oxidoreductase [Halomonas desiderata]OUE47197.1 short-chain dehydrogenase [Halomonas desiderata SP1]
MTSPNETRRIWLTGATSGIGRAVALRLLDRGHLVALSGRSEPALKALCEGRNNALPLPLDVTDRGAVEAAGRHLGDLFGRLDLAVLNAGTCEYLDAPHLDSALVERVFAVNFFGAVYCISAALPLLRQARQTGRRPQLAATSSAAAYLALPRAEAYGASKAALSHYLESLRLDLAHEGIDVSVIHPGFVATPLTARNDFAMPMRISAETAAQAIVTGLEKRRLDIHFPRRFTYGLRLLGLLPPPLRYRLGKRLVRHPAMET